VELQSQPAIFVLECIFTLYLLMSQGVMVDKYLQPAIIAICDTYKLSKSIGGVLIAVGVSVTELTACCLSFQRHGVKMTEFGMAMNIGGLAFSVSLIPVLAYAMNYGFNKPRPEAPTTEVYEFSRSRFKWCFLRDIALMQCSLIGYFLSLDTGTMTVQAVALQLTIFASYCALVYTQDIHFTKKLQSLKSESEAQDGE